MSTTIIFMVASIFIIGIYDAWIIKTKGKYESISAYIIRGSKKMPLLVLLAGVVLGHLFWSMDTFDQLEKPLLKVRCEKFLSTYKLDG